MNQAQKAICLSPGIVKQLNWQRLLGVSEAKYYARLMRSVKRSLNDADMIVDWGNKRQAAANKMAQRYNKPLLRLEDGFIRSIGLGQVNTKAKHQAYSLVVDDVGIYYDATRPSRLENILVDGQLDQLPSAELATPMTPLDLDDPQLLNRADQCIKTITQHNLSKYNDSDQWNLGIKNHYRLLLVDQVRNDLSIAGANANSDTFKIMLDAALQAHPDAEIIIKSHPASRLAKGGHYDQAMIDHMVGELPSFTGKVHLLQKNCNPLALVKQVDEVYVVSSQLGFEALMLEKKVVCFGLPFYAGWGLTEDRQTLARRNKQRSLQQVFAAAYLMYSHYFDPLTDQPCELELLLDFFIRQRQQFERNRGINLCLGFPPWKRGYLRRFLFSPWGETRFFNRRQSLLNYLSKPLDQQVSGQYKVLFWGDSGRAIDLSTEQEKIKETVRVEDGFIRSVGLGKYYIPPISLVFDSAGIYYDPATESELEKIISAGDFSDDDLQLAQRVQEKLLKTGVTKYNIGQQALPKPLLEAKKAGKKIILVPGQVEDDASIAAACEEVKDDFALVKAVKERDSEAIIVYKPHPDVVSGHSPASARHDAIVAIVDYRVTEVNVNDCLAIADEVHTMSSLTGFEALLRGKLVFTYGKPFYAGWGLTSDKFVIARRNREVPLLELIAAVLIIYPRYIDYRQGFFINAEQALEHIILTTDSEQGRASSSSLKVGEIPRRLRKFSYFISGLCYSLRLKCLDREVH